MATYQRGQADAHAAYGATEARQAGLKRWFFIVDALSDEIRVAEAIARASNSFDELDGERVVYLAAQAADAHVDHVGGTLKIVAPDVGFDHVACDEAIGVAHEVFEERVLSRG